MNQDDYYQILDVSPDTDAGELKEAYRRLALKYHPDRNENDPDAALKMQQINEAYAVLSDPRKRSEYDDMRRQFGSDASEQFRRGYGDQDIFTGSDIEQIFEELSRTFGLRGFEDIFKTPSQSGFKSFHGKRSGLSFSGFCVFGGSIGPGGFHGILPKGSLIGKLFGMMTKLLPGEQTPGGGQDLVEPLTLSETLAKEGGPYAYYHKALSKKLIVHIPPGTRDGRQIRLAGMGISAADGSSRGDLYLKVTIKKSLGEKLKGFLGR